MKKSLPYILAVCAFLGILGFSIAQAGSDNRPAIMEKLVERFNLDPEEVEEFFDEMREERMEQMQVHFREKLDQAVSDGDLTEEQKDMLLAKKEEMREKHEEMKDLSPEERGEAMKQYREELRAWAEDNGIQLNFAFGYGVHRNLDKGMKMGKLRFDQ